MDNPSFECNHEDNNDDDSAVYFDESFFINESYVVQSFQYGSHVIDVLCLISSATDYDLTGQIVWPGAELLNNYLISNSMLLQGGSIIELGSGVGLTGLLCARFCDKVVMTDHNDTVLKVLKRNIEMQISEKGFGLASMTCEKLEWGSKDDLLHILKSHPEGFDIILGADICYQQNCIPLLFETVKNLLAHKLGVDSKFIFAYVSRAKSIDATMLREAKNHNLEVNEISGTRKPVSNGVYEGSIYEMRLIRD